MGPQVEQVVLAMGQQQFLPQQAFLALEASRGEQEVRADLLEEQEALAMGQQLFLQQQAFLALEASLEEQVEQEGLKVPQPGFPQHPQLHPCLLLAQIPVRSNLST